MSVIKLWHVGSVMNSEKGRSAAPVTNSCWQFSAGQRSSFQQPLVTVAPPMTSATPKNTCRVALCKHTRTCVSHAQTPRQTWQVVTLLADSGTQPQRFRVRLSSGYVPRFTKRSCQRRPLCVRPPCISKSNWSRAFLSAADSGFNWLKWRTSPPVVGKPQIRGTCFKAKIRLLKCCLRHWCLIKDCEDQRSTQTSSRKSIPLTLMCHIIVWCRDLPVKLSYPSKRYLIFNLSLSNRPLCQELTM